MNIPTKQHPWKNIQIRIVGVDPTKITAADCKWANAQAMQVWYMIDEVFQVLKIFIQIMLVRYLC